MNGPDDTLTRQRAGLYRAHVRELDEQDRQDRIARDRPLSRAERKAAEEASSVARTRARGWLEELQKHDAEHGQVRPETLVEIARLAFGSGLPIKVHVALYPDAPGERATLDVILSGGRDRPVYWLGGCPIPGQAQPLSPRERSEAIVEALRAMRAWLDGAEAPMVAERLAGGSA